MRENPGEFPGLLEIPAIRWLFALFVNGLPAIAKIGA